MQWCECEHYYHFFLLFEMQEFKTPWVYLKCYLCIKVHLRTIEVLFHSITLPMTHLVYHYCHILKFTCLWLKYSNLARGCKWSCRKHFQDSLLWVKSKDQYSHQKTSHWWTNIGEMCLNILLGPPKRIEGAISSNILVQTIFMTSPWPWCS